jgi:acetoin utilization deacetylase AcuC-like enzyme
MNLYYHPLMFTSGHPLLRDRVKSIITAAAEFGYIKTEETLLFHEHNAEVAHTPEFIQKMKSFKGLDGQTIWDGTVTNMSACISSVIDVMNGNRISFALRSDGGHHASSNSQWDMCYINHIAICARLVIQHDSKAKVLIIDTDYHHADGTSEILRKDENVSLLCIHCRGDHGNVDSKTSKTSDIIIDTNIHPQDYLKLLDDQLEALKGQFDILLYDFGFDIYKKDYGGLNSFEYDDVANVAKKVIDFGKNYTKYGISIQLAGGSNPTNAKEIFHRLFELIKP